MKLRYIYLLAIGLMATFTMCRKSNDYNYKEIPDLWIDTSGAQVTFTVKQTEELVITPKVMYNGDKTLEYYWIRSSRQFSGYPVYDDTVSREKDLRITINLPVTIANNPDAPYSFFFQVKEKETGNIAFFPFKVSVTGGYGTGILVAHEKNGTADFDMIETPTGVNSPVYRNIHQTVNGTRLPGKVAGIGSTGSRAFCLFMTDKAASMVSHDGMKLRFSDGEIFGALNPPVFKPEGFGNYGNYCFVINDGQVYVNYNATSVTGVMTTKLKMSDGSAYRMAPLYLRPYLQGGIFFDELNGRFVQTTPYNVDGFQPVMPANSDRKFSLHHINKKLIAYRRGFNLSSDWMHSTVYAVFADKGNNAQLSLYVFNMDTPLTPDYALVDISGITDIQQAIGYESSAAAPVLYYATASKIYALQINAGGNSVVPAGVQFTAPAGEEITRVFSDNNSNRFYIATYLPATGESKVYLYGMTSGTGLFNAAPTKTWTGFGGKIVAMETKR